MPSLMLPTPLRRDLHLAEPHLQGKMPRKIRKPMMEKRRRARINESLDRLKLLLFEYNAELRQNEKLEKADILEMAVRFLETLRNTTTTTTTTSTVTIDNHQPAESQQQLVTTTKQVWRPW